MDAELSRLRNRLNALEAIVLGARQPSSAAASSSSGLTTALTSAHLFVGNATNVATDTAITGDVTISNAGVTAIGAAKVTEAMQILANNTTNDVSASKHGYAPIASGTGTKFLNDAGSYSTPTGGSGGGLFAPVLSAIPTASSTGFSTWMNQGGTAVTRDDATGLRLEDLTSGGGGTVLRALNKAVPSTPYSAKALIALDLSFDNASSAAGFGWTDGTKLQAMMFQIPGSGSLPMNVYSFNSTTSFNSTQFTASTSFGAWVSTKVWLRLRDDGTNVSFAVGIDGVNFTALYTVAKASGFLGSSGYTKLALIIGPQGQTAALTLMSYAETA